MRNEKYIILYSDEFKEDVWKTYMDILELDYSQTEVKIIIKDIVLLQGE